MSDLVVTVPRRQWEVWLDEGDLPGQPWSGDEYHFYLGYICPPIAKKERVYIWAHGRLRGYAPLVRIDTDDRGMFALVRHGDAVACTIPDQLVGFRGYRVRWWRREDEVPFEDWKTQGVNMSSKVECPPAICPCGKEFIPRIVYNLGVKRPTIYCSADCPEKIRRTKAVAFTLARQAKASYP